MVLIDLDGDAPPAARRLRVRHAGRWWGLAAVLVLIVVATLDRRAPPDLRPVTRLPAGTMRIVATGDAFYVLRGNGSLAWNVTAYAWRDAVERWRRPLAGPDPDVLVAGGAVFVTHQPCDAQHPPAVDRLAPATGRPAWQAGGAVLSAPDGGTLLLARSGTGCGAARRVADLDGVDVTTGAARWTVRFAPPRTVVAGPGWFAARAGDGSVDTYATATGARLASGMVPPSGTAVAAGDVLVVVTGRRLTTYHQGSMASGWGSDLNSAPDAVGACGSLLCLATGTILTAVDPISGELQWQRTALRQVVAGPSYVVGDGDAGLQLIAWRDGRVVADLRDWTALPQADDSTDVILQRTDGDRVAIGLADLRAGTIRTLGRLPRAQTRCVTGPRRLACVDPAGTTTVWRTMP
jgi:hypothetical protein